MSIYTSSQVKNEKKELINFNQILVNQGRDLILYNTEFKGIILYFSS